MMMKAEKNAINEFNNFVEFCKEIEGRKSNEKKIHFQKLKKYGCTTFSAAWTCYKLSLAELIVIEAKEFRAIYYINETLADLRKTYCLDKFFVGLLSRATTISKIIKLTTAYFDEYKHRFFLVLGLDNFENKIKIIRLTTLETYAEDTSDLEKSCMLQSSWSSRNWYLSEDFDIDSLINHLTDLRLERMKKNDKI